MDSKTFFQLLPFLLLVSNLFFKSCSLNPKIETEYNKWILWHVNEFQKMELGSKIIDMGLMNAEMNKLRITVGQDGTGDFKTITEAIASIPKHNTRRVILFIKPGVYKEKINIPGTLPFVTFLGDSSDPPTITGNDTASTRGRDGKPFLKTYGSATVAIEGDYFVAVNMKFENTAFYDGGDGEQAVALRTSGDKAAFYNCSFFGHQDTLYDHKGTHYFNNCFIQGAVDFVFGYGRSLYENCNLNSITKNKSCITAQKRNSTTLSSGFSFKNCKVTGTGLVYLGRAWGEYSRVVFSYSYMDNIVVPEGWSNWGNPERNSTVYYGEYKCSGPGANFKGREPWARQLTDEEAKPFIGTDFIYGDTWLINP